MEVLFFYTVFVVVITVWAKAWGRNGLCYFLLAVLCPLIAGRRWPIIALPWKTSASSWLSAAFSPPEVLAREGKLLPFGG